MKNTVKINSVDLINADCLHFIQSLPDDSIDLIVTDPPYFKVKPNGWDNQWKGDEDYLKWLDHCLAQFWRVLKPAGSLYLFCGHRLASDIEIMMRERFNVLNHIIWAKPSGRWNGCNKESLRAYFPATERVLFAEHYQGPYRGKSDGYAAKERELKQHIMAPLISYFRDARAELGVTAKQIAEATGKKNMVSHWFGASQWQLPNEADYVLVVVIRMMSNVGARPKLMKTASWIWYLIPIRPVIKEAVVPQRNDRSRSTPTTSPKNNSWFRMQAGHQSDADIYIYDEIGFWGVTAKQFISDLNALGDITHINLHINSPGGDVFEGIAIFNALKTHGASITVYVDGVAASMASVIAMVGNPVIMPENTFMMIHKPFGFTGGDAEDMRTYADLLDKVEAVLLPAYAQKTGKTTDEIAAMLADETWMSGAECLAHGFADQVTPAVKAMACIQSKRTEEFKKMPESIRNMITPPRNSAPRVQDNESEASRTPVQAAAPVVDENSIRAQVLAEQKARVNGINDLFAMFGGRHLNISPR